jgi:ATP-dependent RNA helicase SUPV3L1/SUV3
VGLRQAAADQGISDELYSKVLNKFCKLIKSSDDIKENQSLYYTLQNIANGATHVDSLYPHLIDHAHNLYPTLYILPELKKISDLTSPAQWYPAARSMKRHFIIHAGPTNSGKTHHALQSFLSSETGVYCAPLRMLAVEISQRSNNEGVPCDLVTGEERIYASGNSMNISQHLACTVEMISTDIGTMYDVAVIDEVQMVRDQERGGAWTRAILGIPAKEVHLCGEPSVIKVMERLLHMTGDTMEVKRYQRLSPLVPLSQSLKGSYSNVRPGDCVVAFSRQKVYEIKREIEKATRHSCAIIYGGLPSVNRQSQANLFNVSGSKVDVIVATDAIGMGVNLNIRRIIFHTLHKKFSSKIVQLTSFHVKQIAGRAGRYGKNFPKGEVTSFYSRDLQLLHKLLSSPITNIKRVGITPGFEQLQLFANQLPKLKLHELLRVFKGTTELNSNFFLCNEAIKGWMEVSQLISSYNLSLKDTFNFSLAPVNLNIPLIRNVFCEYVRNFSTDKPVTITEVHDILKWPFSPPISALLMTQWEDAHEALDLYLWLSQRYEDHFPDGDKVKQLQMEIEKIINDSLLVSKGYSRLNKMKSSKSGSRLSTKHAHRASTGTRHVPLILPHVPSKSSSSNNQKQDKRSNYLDNYF